MILTDPSLIDREVNKAIETGAASLDTETTSLDYHVLQMVGYSFAYSDPWDQCVKAFYVPVGHNVGTNAPVVQAIDGLKRLAEQSGTIVMHNAKFDIKVLRKYEIVIEESKIEDTMIMAHLIDENRRVGLKILSKAIFNYEQSTLEEVLNKRKIEDLDPEEIDSYASDDAEYTLKLWQHFTPIIAEQGLEQVHDKIEKPFIHVLVDMKRMGVPVNDELRLRMEVEAKAQAETKLRDVYNAFGEEINLNSTKQLGRILYEKMGLPILAKTPKGAPSCSAAALEKLSERGFGVAQEIMDYRWYTKMNNTFLKNLEPQYDGCIFPDFHQTGTVTGRLSSSNPNMQNYPSESRLGVRACVIPFPGDVLGVVDWSQIELRLTAHFSGDRNMLQAFREGMDIHQMTADLMGIERGHAKTLNFGILYGMAAHSLSENLHIDKQLAQEYIDGWFGSYSGVQDFKRWVEGEVQRTGYVTTLSGRRRRLPDVFSRDWKKRGYALRQSLNSVIQGSGADLMKYSMVKVREKYEQKPPARMFSTVHDEMLISLTPDTSIEVSEDIKNIMETCVELQVPIVADMKIVDNWWWGKWEEGKPIPPMVPERRTA